MNRSIRSAYRFIVSAVKRLDRMTGYKIGDLVRALTNINTRRYWDRCFARQGDFYRVFPYENIADFLPKDAPFSLLDIGCALGDGCEFLQKRFPGAEISGADFSLIGIQKAKERSDKIRYFLLDITKEEPQHAYDYIVLSHILEHLNDPLAIVGKCLRHVNRAILVSTPYCPDCKYPRLYAPAEHRYLFNERTFDKYNSTVLRITPLIEATGYRNIIYKIEPVLQRG